MGPRPIFDIMPPFPGIKIIKIRWWWNNLMFIMRISMLWFLCWHIHVDMTSRIPAHLVCFCSVWIDIYRKYTWWKSLRLIAVQQIFCLMIDFTRDIKAWILVESFTISSQPYDTYMSQRTGSSLVEKMDCHLCNTKPLSRQMRAFHQYHSREL